MLLGRFMFLRGLSGASSPRHSLFYSFLKGSLTTPSPFFRTYPFGRPVLHKIKGRDPSEAGGPLATICQVLAGTRRNAHVWVMMDILVVSLPYILKR